MTLPSSLAQSGRTGARTRRRFWTRIWSIIVGSALAYLPVALAPHLLHRVARRTDDIAHDEHTPIRSGVLTTLTPSEAAAVLGVLAALVIALNLIAWSLGRATTSPDSAHTSEALRLEHVELCGSVLGVGASMAFVAALVDGLPESVDLAALLLFPAVFVIVVLSQDLFLATQRGAGARRVLRRESSLLRRRELLTTAARLRPTNPYARRHPGVVSGIEFAALTVVTAAAGLVLLAVFDDDPAAWRAIGTDDILATVQLSAILVFTSVVLVPWTVRCWLLRRYVGAVLSVAVGGTLYVVLGVGIIWAALDEEDAVEALAVTLILLGWAFLPPVVLAIGTTGVGGRGRFPGVSAVLHSALLRERHRLRRAALDDRSADGHAIPPLRHIVARARAAASATTR